MAQKEPEFDINIEYDQETGLIHDYCTSRGFPLGGIGTGGFSIFTDGGFGKFRTNHNWFKSIDQAEYPKGTFCALWCKTKEKKVAKLLRRDYHGGQEFQNTENIQHTQFHGIIPWFDLTFQDEGLPADISLSGFTGLIPHNVKDSSLPIAFFQAEVKNPSNEGMDISFLFSFENILGIGGSGGWKWVFPFNGPVTYNSTEGNYNEKYTQGDLHGLAFRTRQSYGFQNPRMRTVGDYYLITDVKQTVNRPDKIQITYCPEWNSNQQKLEFWKQFQSTGAIGPIETEERKKDGLSGSIAIKTRLKPKEKKTINFYLVWWMPYHVIEKRQRLRKFLSFVRHKGINYGHYWMNHFTTPQELINYAVKERERIATQSREVIELIQDATLPPWLKTYLLNSTDSMLINTVLTKRKNYYMMEGVPWNWPPGALTGTIDQRLASHIYSANFFPSLDINELLSFYDLTENGRVPHGNGHADVALGTDDVPYGQPIRIFNRTNQWVDLPQSFLLQVGKHIIQSKNINLLKRVWKKIPDMMDYLDRALVNDVPEGITTYDYMKYHPCFIYTATLHLATLKMVVRLAKLMQNESDPESRQYKELSRFIDKYQRQYQATNRSYQKRLWREKPEGGYFKTCETRDTIFTSALAGDWISRLSGLKPVVDYKKAISHSEWQKRLLVDSHSFTELNGQMTRPLIYREANFEGEEMPVRVLLYKKYHVNNPWQVLAYQAIESIYLGKVEEGLDVVKKIWEKGYYEGYPWDMDHWGMKNHIYMTHPAMWSILNALTGAAYDAFEEKLIISPRLIGDMDTYELPVFFPGFWLKVEYSQEMTHIGCKIIKSFQSDLLIKKVAHRHPSGEEKVYSLDNSVKIVTGARFEVKLT
mgnify:CR=1 FL=1